MSWQRLSKSTPYRRVAPAGTKLPPAPISCRPASYREAGQRPEVRVEAAPAVEVALVVLLDAVAGDVVRVGQRWAHVPRVADGPVRLLDEAEAGVLEEGEVAEERELVAARIDLEGEGVRGVRCVGVVEIEVLPIGPAALRRIDRPEAVQATGGYLTQRDLARAAPAPLVEGRRERELRERGRLERELGEEVVAVVVLR